MAAKPKIQGLDPTGGQIDFLGRDFRVGDECGRAASELPHRVWLCVGGAEEDVRLSKVDEVES